MMFVILKDSFASQENPILSHNCWSKKIWKYIFREKTHMIVT